MPLKAGPIWATAVFKSDPLAHGWSMPQRSPDWLFDPSVPQLSRKPVHTIADPFLFCGDDDRLYLFAEIQRAGEAGRIHVAELHENGRYSPWKSLALPPGHFSFPFVFRDGNSIFLIPESVSANGGAGEVALYQFTRFPYELEFLMNWKSRRSC